MPELGTAVGWASLGLGVLCALVGLVLVWIHRNEKIPAVTDTKLGDQGAVVDAIKATTDFAKALKDLDRGIQLLTLGVLFIAVAAIAAGFDAVADAITTAAGT
jgi:hypothetical protein